MQVWPSYTEEFFYVWELHSTGNSCYFTNRSHNTSKTWILLDPIYRCALRDIDRLDFSKVTVNEELQAFSIFEIHLQSFSQGTSVTGWAGNITWVLTHSPPWATWILYHNKCIAQRPEYTSVACASVFGTLTVMSSFSTQSGDTLCKWVKWSWRCILLLRTSWQRGQQITGCIECCDRTCIWIRFGSLLL